LGKLIAAAIPFDDRKLGIVELSDFTGPKRPRDLINRFGAGSKQPLHAELGGGLQVERAAPVRSPRIVGQTDGQWIEMPVDDRIG